MNGLPILRSGSANPKYLNSIEIAGNDDSAGNCQGEGDEQQQVEYIVDARLPWQFAKEPLGDVHHPFPIEQNMDDNGPAQSDSEPFMPAFSSEHGLHGYDVSCDQQDVQVEFGFRF